MGNKKVKIEKLGKEFEIGFDFSVMIEHEELFAEQLEITELTSTAKQMKAVFASIKAFNDCDVRFDEFLHALSIEEFKELNEAVVPPMQKFYRIPVMAEEHVAVEKNTEEQEEEKSPNA